MFHCTCCTRFTDIQVVTDVSKISAAYTTKMGKAILLLLFVTIMSKRVHTMWHAHGALVCFRLERSDAQQLGHAMRPII